LRPLVHRATVSTQGIGMKDHHEKLGRALTTALSISVGLLLASCGKTANDDPAPPEQGGEGGNAPVAGTSPSVNAGASTVGGSGGQAAGGSDASPAEGGEGGEGGQAALCIEGASCRCGELSGTLHCTDGAPGGDCACPPAEVCEAKSGKCFEPCGGNPRGLWVYEDACFPSGKVGGCEGAFIEGKTFGRELHVLILKDEALLPRGEEGVDVTAKVPLSCVGIETVDRCDDVDYYASPLLFGLSRPLECKASECGHCECSGRMEAGGGSGYHAFGQPWVPGAETLWFGGMEVPYCAKGDTLWVGGVSTDGTPKVAYKFRRQSCYGTPVPCTERSDEECGADCTPGRCVADGGDPSVCKGLEADLEQCQATTGCRWDPKGCWGDSYETCEFRTCGVVPGCTWGPPVARCGGQPTPCIDHSVEHCAGLAGCAVKTCFRDGPSDTADCAGLVEDLCAEATGCTWSGGACKGTTTCTAQENLAACSALGCFGNGEEYCVGTRELACSDLTVEECEDEPSCRIEW
jgi:hypothetical protein